LEDQWVYPGRISWWVCPTGTWIITAGMPEGQSSSGRVSKERGVKDEFNL